MLDEALAAARKLTEKSQLHPGCILYDLYISATRPDSFIICETWQDQASLDAHSATPEFAECVAITHRCCDTHLDRFEL